MRERAGIAALCILAASCGDPGKPPEVALPPSAASASRPPLSSFHDNSRVEPVRYFGMVDLARYDCEDERDSSFIERFCYHHKEHRVIVTLNGVNYAYCGVDQLLYYRWRHADSRGRFYNAEVKGRYACR